MALKAGRVGVHPSQVDRSGKVIGGGVDAYTKAESDAKFATKEALGDYVEVEDYTADLAEINTALSGKADAEAVTTALAAKADSTAVTAALALKADQSNLTANDNNFIFAYDSASQKYGYKAGGADTFHPFSESGPVPIFELKTLPNPSEGSAVLNVSLNNQKGFTKLAFVRLSFASSKNLMTYSIFDLVDGEAVQATKNYSNSSGTTSSNVFVKTDGASNLTALLDESNNRLTITCGISTSYGKECLVFIA